jgi:hypothetical protein
MVFFKQNLGQVFSHGPFKMFCNFGQVFSHGLSVVHVRIFVGTSLHFFFNENALGMKLGLYGFDDGLCGLCYRPYTHLQTWKSLNPISVSLEAQCLNPNPLSPRFGFLLSRFTPREAKGGRP